MTWPYFVLVFAFAAIAGLLATLAIVSILERITP